MQIGIDSFAAVVSDPKTGETLSPAVRLRNLIEEIELADHYFNVDELVTIIYFTTCFRMSLVRNPIIMAAAAVSLSGITGQMELSATKTFFVP